MTFDIGLHEVCVRVGVRYVITKFSRMDSLPNFVTHGAPLRALRARESSAIMICSQCKKYKKETTLLSLDCSQPHPGLPCSFPSINALRFPNFLKRFFFYFENLWELRHQGGGRASHVKVQGCSSSRLGV